MLPDSRGRVHDENAAAEILNNVNDRDSKIEDIRKDWYAWMQDVSDSPPHGGAFLLRVQEEHQFVQQVKELWSEV